MWTTFSLNKARLLKLEWHLGIKSTCHHFQTFWSQDMTSVISPKYLIRVVIEFRIFSCRAWNCSRGHPSQFSLWPRGSLQHTTDDPKNVTIVSTWMTPGSAGTEPLMPSYHLDHLANPASTPKLTKLFKLSSVEIGSLSPSASPWLLYWYRINHQSSIGS